MEVLILHKSESMSQFS